MDAHTEKVLRLESGWEWVARSQRGGKTGQGSSLQAWAAEAGDARLPAHTRLEAMHPRALSEAAFGEAKRPDG